MASSYYERGATGVGGTNQQIASVNRANLIHAASRGSSGRRSGGSMPAESRKMWEEAIAHYAPGGGYGKGVEAGLERGRTKSLASGMQSLVSAGLSNTTQAAGLGKKYEEEVAAPTRAGVESQRAQAIASLKAGMAGAMQSGYESAANRSTSLAGMYNFDQNFNQTPSMRRTSPQQSPQQRTQLPTHEDRIPSPYGTARRGGYSPGIKGFKGLYL